MIATSSLPLSPQPSIAPLGREPYQASLELEFERRSPAPSHAARLARAAMHGCFVWAMRAGLVEANPVIGTLQPAVGKARDRILTDDELAAIWNACASDDYFDRIVRLLILTGQRRQEIGGMCWTELDLGKGLFLLPAERAKNEQKHIVPLITAGGIIGTPTPGTTGPMGAWGEIRATMEFRVKRLHTGEIRTTVAE